MTEGLKDLLARTEELLVRAATPESRCATRERLRNYPKGSIDMLARIRKSMNEKDQGFTLIELLVVMIIIGILAAIAIPVFLNQRKKAVDSSIKSDLKTIATAEETAYTDKNAYVAVAGGTGTLTIGDTVKVSSGNTFTVKLVDTTGYCIEGSAATGKATQTWVYNSTAGGLQASSVTACV
ncbi:type IV pilin protein [Kineococcus sp. NBC_00420]|uniref:type IV pilin protein n=1 Tax=Kineococcus sp. NBC_00420 TaxID=2903564 RepID=UPI002E1BF2C0